MSIEIQPCSFHKHPVEILSSTMQREAIDRVKFARQVLLDPNFDPYLSLLAKFEGEPAGYVLGLRRKVPLENAPDDSDRGYITLFGVLDRFRNRGVGTQVLAAVEQSLGDRGCKSIWISPYAPGYFLPGVDVQAHPTGLDFLKRRGYVEVYRPISMECELWDFERPAWVRDREAEHRNQGIAYTEFTPALVRPLIEFAERAFQGDWVRVCRSSSLKILDGDNPRRIQIAVDNAQSEPRVLGFSHHEGERFGPIGVDPGQRGRGIGQILMYRTLQAQREAGYRTSWFLWSDEKTADRLYNAAGFRLARTFALLKKDL